MNPETKSWFLKKIHKIDKLVKIVTSGQTKQEKKRDKTQLINIINERGDITTDYIVIKIIINEQLIDRKLDNLAEMDQFFQ